MTPEEWPIWSPPQGGEPAPVLRSGRDRLPTVRRDFFLDPRFRLTEQERALMTAMLHRLVGDVAVEIQSLLPADWLPANEDHEGLIRRLSERDLLDIEGLIALLLRRTDEERITIALEARSQSAPRPFLQSLVSSDDAEVAAAAMALLIARGRRRDRYGRAMVELDDLSSDAASRLVHVVAAGLRERLPVFIDSVEAERALGGAAASVIGNHDPARSADRLLDRLAVRLNSAGALHDRLFLAAIEAADLAFLAHALGERAAIPAVAASDELMSCAGRRVMSLLRLAGLPRSVAAGLLATLGDLIGLDGEVQHLETFDSLSDDRLAAARTWNQLEPGFREALQQMGNGHGHRPF